MTLHEQRKKIEDNLVSLRERQGAAEVGRLKREAEEQKRNLRDAHIDHVRGTIGGAELATVESEADAAQQAHADAVERQTLLDEAIAKETRELQRHLVENFDLYARDCMKVAEQVEINRAKVNDIIVTMRGQLNQLHAKWAPLVSAAKLLRNIPMPEIEPVPTIPLRPPGIDADGKVIRGQDEYGRQLGDRGVDREARTERLLDQARREQAEAAARQAGITVPEGADAEVVIDAARAMTPAEMEALKEQDKREREANREANLAATKE